jgi:hypothetical protein
MSRPHLIARRRSDRLRHTRRHRPILARGHR